jgi:hypothetical protein
MTDSDKYKMTADQTVEGRLDGIMAKDSPLMQRAATQGTQYANQRGLLNSSMAAGAAQGAMIDRATPIAQQDAQQAWQRGNMGLEHDFTTGRDKTLHGYNREQDSWRHDQTLDRDSIQQGYTQDNMHLGHGFNREQDSWRHGQTLDRDSVQQGYHQDNMNLGHTQGMERDQAGYSHQRTMTELNHVLGMEHMEWAKNLDQRHQRELMELGQEFQRISQYEAGLQNVWNGFLNMASQQGSMTSEQMNHFMQQMMPMMQNTKDFYQSLYR